MKDKDAEWCAQLKNGEEIKPPPEPKWIKMYDEFDWFDPLSYTYYPTKKETKERFREEATYFIKNGMNVWGGKLTPEMRKKIEFFMEKL